MNMITPLPPCENGDWVISGDKVRFTDTGKKRLKVIFASYGVAIESIKTVASFKAALNRLPATYQRLLGKDLKTLPPALMSPEAYTLIQLGLEQQKPSDESTMIRDLLMHEVSALKVAKLRTLKIVK